MAWLVVSTPKYLALWILLNNVLPALAVYVTKKKLRSTPEIDA